MYPRGYTFICHADPPAKKFSETSFLCSTFLQFGITHLCVPFSIASGSAGSLSVMAEGSGRRVAGRRMRDRGFTSASTHDVRVSSCGRSRGFVEPRATRATSFLGRPEILGSCFRFRFSASDSTQPGQLRARSCHSRPRPDAFASGDPFCATCAHARVSVSEHSVRSPRSCPTGRVIISVPNPAP